MNLITGVALSFGQPPFTILAFVPSIYFLLWARSWLVALARPFVMGWEIGRSWRAPPRWPLISFKEVLQKQNKILRKARFRRELINGAMRVLAVLLASRQGLLKFGPETLLTSFYSIVDWGGPYRFGRRPILILNLLRPRVWLESHGFT